MRTPGPPPIPKLTITVDVVDSMAGFTEPQRVVAQALRVASFRTAELVRNTWVSVAQELMPAATGDYLSGISVDGRIDVQGPVSDPNADWYETMITVTNTSKHASIVEDGNAAYSLPQAIRWGSTPKVKYTNKGTPYLTIPFRHRAHQSPAQQATSGMTMASRRSMMPAEVYGQAKKLAPSSGMNAGRQYDAQGRYRAADRYQWGGRLTHNVGIGKEARRGPRQVEASASGEALSNPSWSASRWDGMVKMKGGKNHTAYLTFRIITPNSKGWRIPARAGMKIAQRVLQNIESGELGRAIATIVQADVTAAIDSLKGGG